MRKVRIAQFPRTRVAVLTHLGPASGLAPTLQQFVQWRRRTGLTPDRSATFTVLHSSPAAGEFRHDLCAATEEPIPANPEGVSEGYIPAARCAVVRLEGEDAGGLPQTLEWLHREWLAANGEVRAALPPFAQRLVLGEGASEAGMVTDLFVPLR